MSDRQHLPIRHQLGGVKVCSGNFTPNDTGDVDNDLNAGTPVTVTRTGVGVFTLAFGTAYQELLFAQAEVMQPVSGNFYKVEVAAVTDGPSSLAEITLKVYLQDPVSGVFAAEDIADGDGIIAYRAEFTDQGAQ